MSFSSIKIMAWSPWWWWWWRCCAEQKLPIFLVMFYKVTCSIFSFSSNMLKEKKKSADLHPFCETNFKHFLCIWIWVGRNQTSALSMALLQTFTLQWTSPKNKMEQKLIWEQTRQGCLNLRYLLINVSADCICESRWKNQCQNSTVHKPNLSCTTLHFIYSYIHFILKQFYCVSWHAHGFLVKFPCGRNSDEVFE